ncbi:hypothetical protein AVEN_146099-1 [Araneus ventricosus]|uniref:Uncharacterized protein n=1 Tax=Araneus ventricosus TaxID=182803 RepID=A0A4Y2VH72_ARAVE|nr:hypothetical protein AVEN_146099-1 [Araneus ventricosus]
MVSDQRLREEVVVAGSEEHRRSRYIWLDVSANPKRDQLEWWVELAGRCRSSWQQGWVSWRMQWQESDWISWRGGGVGLQANKHNQGIK